MSHFEADPAGPALAAIRNRLSQALCISMFISTLCAVGSTIFMKKFVQIIPVTCTAIIIYDTILLVNLTLERYILRKPSSKTDQEKLPVTSTRATILIGTFLYWSWLATMLSVGFTWPGPPEELSAYETFGMILEICLMGIGMFPLIQAVAHCKGERVFMLAQLTETPP